MRSRFLAALAEPRETYPLPVSHCSICDWLPRCAARREADDHLCLVAGMRRDWTRRLEGFGVRTLSALGELPPGEQVEGLRPEVLERLREQAALQLGHRRTGEHVYRLLPPRAGRGLALLPEPSPGDLFFDIEGDPYWEPAGGLEYLLGLLWAEDGEPRFRPFWAHDRTEERHAFEQLVDTVVERRRRFPGLHVYHYAAYERIALRRLAGAYGTREEEVDDLLRGGVLVDLYAAVRDALRHSHPNYSIKSVETFYLRRRAALRAGEDSILAYERYVGTRDPRILEEIAAYNEEDCLSTLLLRDWLLERRAEAGPVEPPPQPEPRTPSEAAVAETAEQEALRERLTADPDDRERWLAGQLLE